MNDSTTVTPGPAAASLRPFFALWTGQALSLVGSRAVQFAVIWWLTAETGSAAVLAMAAFVGLLPQIVLGPMIGALVDRWNRKHVMLAADAVVALASLALAALYFSGAVRLEYVYALLFVRAIGGAFHFPAMMASTSLMVPERHLARIQGMNQMVQGGLQIVAAPIGALLVARLPMHSVMIVDVVTAVFAIVPLIFIRVPQPFAGADDGGTAPSLRREMVEGVTYLRERSGHMTLLGIAVLVNMCMVPAFSLLPLLVAGRGGGPTQLAWLSSTLGIGTIGGGILLGLWGGFDRRILTTLVGLIGAGAATIALGAAPPSPAVWALVSILAVGLAIPLINGPIHAILQATVAPEFQGRVFTLYASLSAMATPVGLLAAAPVAEIAGAHAWFYVGGLTCATVGIAGFFMPTLLRLESGAD